MDSGIISHMINDQSSLRECKEIEMEVGSAKKNVSMKAIATGKVDLGSCELQDVFLVSELRHLLSVNVITQKEEEVLFKKDSVIVCKNSKEIFRGQRSQNGFYYIKGQEVIRKLETFLVDKQRDWQEWHKKLGHLSYGNMKKLLGMVTGIPLEDEELHVADKTCKVCFEAKHSKMPFGEFASKKTTRIDTCGCMRFSRTSNLEQKEIFYDCLG